MLKASIQANFDHGRMTLVSYSPGLFVSLTGGAPALDGCLNGLGMQGWRVVGAGWQGFELTLELEQMTGVPFRPPYYLFQCLCQLRSLKGPTDAAASLKALVSDFRQHALADGWTELCTSNPLAEGGVWMVTLWMKEAENE